ncbi:down syndrome cell adhesion molecule [Trichonephila inaurata madagascariensis]|uniref:Down syndrome cell adhesion molecule n=2 Tax=Trichonephila inaurata madagascariensis TaxID=2747483 RepID=A0A8X7BRD7_9ARAC|nr:down syndrome cell adhesion molecule [Trichonephila inaurata madagascariensis]
MWPVSQQVSTGSTVTINCTVSGHPISAIEWMRNQHPLSLSRRVVLISRTVLHITTVEREDKGMYQCVARNDEDSAQGSAQLTIACEYTGIYQMIACL